MKIINSMRECKFCGERFPVKKISHNGITIIVGDSQFCSEICATSASYEWVNLEIINGINSFIDNLIETNKLIEQGNINELREKKYQNDKFKEEMRERKNKLKNLKE